MTIMWLNWIRKTKHLKIVNFVFKKYEVLLCTKMKTES